MSSLRETLDGIGVRIVPGAGGLLAWWRRSLLAWLPPRWRAQLGLAPARLLLWRDGDALCLARQLDTRVEGLARLPWPQSPLAVERLIGPRLAALPRCWLLPQAAVLQRTLRLPAAASERLRDVVRFEIDRQTPFAAEQVDFDVRVLERRADGQIEAELVVAPKRTVEALLAAIDGWTATLAGIDVAAPMAAPVPQQPSAAGPAPVLDAQRGVADLARTAGLGGSPRLALQADGDAHDRPSPAVATLGANLLPPAQRQQRSDPLRRWQWALAAVAVLGVVLAGRQLLDNRRHAAEALRAQVEAGARRARGVAMQRQQLTDLVEGAAFFERMRAARPTTIEVWNELSRRLPDGSYLEKFAIEGDQLQLIGLSSQASALVGKLEGSPLWHTPSLTGVLRSDDGNRGDRFTLGAQLAAAPLSGQEAADATGKR